MTDLPPDLRAALADRYRLERPLGQGGMAVVYLAHDVKHDRSVALKVIRPDMSAFLGSRFSREIRLAARLQHPHICSVYDSGETPDGKLWYTMPFVAGESLRHRLSAEPRLPVLEAVRIAREAAQALEYAHKQGVIHRDIKPENILLTEDGNTLVADFGIARAVDTGEDGPRRPSLTQLTEAGHAIGSPAYMAPEQRLGVAADARSDVYSLAATLYEMLAGERASRGGTMDDLVAQMTDPAPRVRLKRPEVPPALDDCLRQALHPDPEQRFASMAAFSAALEAAVSGQYRVPARPGGWGRRVGIAAAAVAVVAAGVAAWRTLATPSRPLLVAVLPFSVPAGDSVLPYLTGSLGEDLRRMLPHVPGIQAVSEATANEIAAARLSTAEIGTRFGADVVVLPSATRADSLVTVTFKVARPARGAAVTEVTVRGTPQWLLDRRDSVLTALLASAGRAPEPDVARAAARYGIGTTVAAAWIDYWRVFDYTRTAPPGGREAWYQVLAMQDSLLALDPRFVDALSDKSLYIYGGLEYQGGLFTPEEVDAFRREMQALVRRAEEVDRGHALTLRAGGYLMLMGKDTAGAIRAFQAASRQEPVFQLLSDLCQLEVVGVPPSQPLPQSCRDLLTVDSLNFDALFSAGQVLDQARRSEDALAAYRRAIQLAPTRAQARLSAGMVLGRLGRYQEALEEMRRAAALEPDNLAVHYFLGTALMATEQPADAVVEFRKLADRVPNDPETLGYLIGALGAANQRDEAIRLSRQLVAMAPRNPASHYRLAQQLWDAGQFGPALRAYRMALDLDPSDLDRWVTMAQMSRLAGRVAEAQAAVDRLAGLAPDSPLALRAAADLASWLGRHDEAVALHRRILAGDTLSAVKWNSLAYAHLLAGRPDSALVAARRAVALDSTISSPYSNIALALALTGKTGEAVAAAARMRQFDPLSQDNIAQEIWFLARDGQRERAQRLLDSLSRRMERHAPSLVPAALAYLGVGDTARARQALATSVQRRDRTWAGAFNLDDPLFAGLRDTPEFAEALRVFRAAGDRR